MTIRIKEEIGHLQPPDQNQPETPSPRAQSDHGSPDTDTEKDNEDLYWARIRTLVVPPRPPKPQQQGSISTGGARQRNPPTPIVLPRSPLPPRNPPALRKPTMGYGRNTPERP